MEPEPKGKEEKEEKVGKKDEFEEAENAELVIDYSRGFENVVVYKQIPFKDGYKIEWNSKFCFTKSCRNEHFPYQAYCNTCVLKQKAAKTFNFGRVLETLKK